ncbi:MAG: glycosyltransferase family 39 protein [Saprospiraceae bacterium]|nr:glycosyltransferase family 39 protein [Saprospiraceae bacterium]
MKFSILSLWITCICVTIISFFYYPKWNKDTTEATISWDVSGYYWYLPAFFTYKDPRKLDFNQVIFDKYRPTPNLQQAFKAPNQNFVFKYSCGQAVMLLPPFCIANVSAKWLGYEADGFTRPYQFAIFLWGLLVSLTGLYILRKILVQYFSETAAGLSLLIIAFGTNFLEYGAITNAMTHNYLFTLYTFLIWLTILFYRKPSFSYAMGIGVCLGLMVLTRPTELVAVIFPLIFGIKITKTDITERIKFLFSQFEKIFLTGVIIVCIGSLQLFYWKFSSGSWIVYSYEDQGFSWLRPHIMDGLFSGRAGWLIYSPVMVLVIPGFIYFYKNYRSLFYCLFIFSALFMYITFAWDIWWYGGSIGQRAMVQIYPVLAFPLAAFIQSFQAVNLKAMMTSLFVVCCIHYNIWVTHQAHYGGLLVAGEMTSEYLKAIFLKNQLPHDARKLLDTKNMYKGEIKQPVYLMTENDSVGYIGNICLNDTVQFSPAKKFKLPSSNGWLRASADFLTIHKEWESWKMTQLILKYYKAGKEINSDVLRAQRHLDPGKKVNLFLDSRLTDMPDEVEILLWNSDGKTEICVDNIRLLFHSGE